MAFLLMSTFIKQTGYCNVEQDADPAKELLSDPAKTHIN
jgi:hypothetical protein